MVVCQVWSCWMLISVGVPTLIRKHTLQLVVWKCHSACSDLLMLTIFTQILKYVAWFFVDGSPPVGLVISGTNWCWCTDTDKEAHFSFY